MAVELAYYTLRPADQLGMAATAASADSHAPVLLKELQYPLQANSSQLWKPRTLEGVDDYFEIRLGSGSLVLDLSEFGWQGDKIIVYPSKSGTNNNDKSCWNQQWKLAFSVHGYLVSCRHSEKCLSSSGDDEQLTLTPSGDAPKWLLVLEATPKG